MAMQCIGSRDAKFCVHACFACMHAVNRSVFVTHHHLRPTLSVALLVEVGKQVVYLLSKGVMCKIPLRHLIVNRIRTFNTIKRKKNHTRQLQRKSSFTGKALRDFPTPSIHHRTTTKGPILKQRNITKQKLKIKQKKPLHSTYLWFRKEQAISQFHVLKANRESTDSRPDKPRLCLISLLF